MTVYAICIVFIGLCYIFSKKRLQIKKKKTQFDHVLIFLVLWGVSGLRYNVGTDYGTYLYYFNEQGTNNVYWLKFEYGYKLLNYIIHLLTKNGQYIFIITSFVILLLVFRTVENNSRSFYMSIFLFVAMYYFFNSFNEIRQYIAIAITFYGIRYLKSKEFIKYFIIIIIACFFHTSAIIMLPFYFILTFSFNKKAYIVLATIEVICSLFYNQLMRLIVYLLPRYAFYINYQREGSTAHLMTIISAIIFIFAYFNFEKIKKTDNSNVLYMNAAFFSMTFNMLSSINILFYRVGSYVSIFLILLIPECFDLLDCEGRKLVELVFVLLIIASCIYLLLNNNCGVMPYTYNTDLHF